MIEVVPVLSTPALVVRNARIPRAGDQVSCDIVLDGRRIAGFTRPGLVTDAAAELDVAGRLVLPGLIDTHVHLGNGRQSVAEDLRSETRMAVAGGMTTICPYLIRPEGYDELMSSLADLVAEQSLVDVVPQLGIVSADQIADVPRLHQTYGVRLFKCFMGYKGTDASPSGIRGIDDAAILELMTVVAAIPGGRLAVHAENMEIIDAARSTVAGLDTDSAGVWSSSRPRIAESEAIQRVLHLAAATGCPVTIPHISVGRDVGRLRRHADEADAVFETCPHYLTLSADDDLGVWQKVNPPLRDEADQDALWSALQTGGIDVLGTDHCPFDADVKGVGKGLGDARAGIPNGPAMLLSLLLDRQARTGELTDLRIAELTGGVAAKRYGLAPVKGALALGADADLVVVDKEAVTTLDSASLGGVATHSPHDGRTLRGGVWATIAGGELVYHDGAAAGGRRRTARLLVDTTLSKDAGGGLVKYGFGILDRPSVRDQIRLAQRAEEGGYSSIWVCETRLARDAISVMGAIAATTEHIQVGSGVVNTWNRNPALMAMTFATLNNLAPDRIIMGLGAYWDPLAAKQGIRRRQPLRQMREYIDVVRRLLALEENVTFVSDLIEVTDLTLDLGHGDPRKPQHVPIYIGATGPKMMQLTGEIADGVVINGLLRPDYVAECLRQLRTGAELAGRPAEKLKTPTFVNVALDDDGEKARETARRLLAMYLGQQPHIAKASGLPARYLDEIRSTVGGWPPRHGGLGDALRLVSDEIALNQTVAGNAGECREQLAKWTSLGVDEIVIVPLTENYEEMIEAFRPG